MEQCVMEATNGTKVENGKGEGAKGAAPAQGSDSAALMAQIAQLQADLKREREAREVEAKALAEERAAVGVIVGEASEGRVKLSGVIHAKDGKPLSLILTAADWRSLSRVGVPRVLSFIDRIGGK
jgi:hypothetical protein